MLYKSELLTLETIRHSCDLFGWVLVYEPKRPFLLRYESRDTRHIDFPQVDG